MSFDASIRYTEHGVAHIRADDWGSLGFGQGWSCARDNLATIADQIVKVRGEWSRFHGRGVSDSLLASDFGYRMLDLRGRAAALRDAQPPELRELVTGYTAGYNRAVADARSDGPVRLPAWCADAEWVRPIDELDLYAWLGDVALMASGRNLAQLIGRAEAPGPDGPVAPSPMEALGPPSAASNGWAVGGDATASGHGMVLANPHFPWFGEARFWECHLQLPGELDVYGVSLLGTPGVQMGFNQGVAWAHTFSCGHRFTVYRLELDAESPTTYRYGDERRDMVSETHSVDVLGGETVERTLWRSHYGPMLNPPLLGWGTGFGFSYRDANLDNVRVLEQFLGMDRATSLESFRAVFDDVRGLPWVNTLAADASGDVWYADASATPRLSDAAQQRFRERIAGDPIAALMYENRIALLDGSDPDDEWLDHPEARSPGLEPPSRLPQLTCRDVVLNANDSHWANHPTERLEGYSVMCGLERTGRSLRTRQNLLQAAALVARGGVTVDDLIAAVYEGPSLSADLLLDAVVARCRAAEPFTIEGHEVDPRRAADVLASWDRRVTLESAGAALWREFMDGFEPAQWRGAGSLFAVDADPDDPVGTPNTLTAASGADPSADPVLRAIGHAVRVLDAAGVPLDAPLGTVQWAPRGSERIPVPGGGEGEGVLNVLGPVGALSAATLEPGPMMPDRIAGRDRTGLSEGGYPVTYGTSFLMAVELTSDGPVGVGVLAYSQSSDPASPHHADGTRAYAARSLRPLRFTDADIDADPALERIELSESGGPTD